jgi:hypothetical protein
MSAALRRLASAGMGLLAVACSEGATLLPTVTPNETSAPARRTPAWASWVDARPCKLIGTFHKQSRMLLEKERARGSVSHDEWECMARQLAAYDAELSQACDPRTMDYDQMVMALRARYLGCLGPGQQDLAASIAPPLMDAPVSSGPAAK